MADCVHAYPNIDYRVRGVVGTSVVMMPKICHHRFVVLSVNNSAGGWAIRDFITNKWLVDTPNGCPRDIVEQEVTYSEHPPFYNVTDPNHHERWEVYLILRTLADGGNNNQLYPTTDPSGNFGGWTDMIPNWKRVQL